MKKIVKIVLFKFAILLTITSQAQVNSINIGTAQQTVNPTTTFNPWIVVQMSTDMATARCYNNTTAPAAPPAATATIAPVALNTAASTITSFPSWFAGTYISCFTRNTIYTPRIAAGTTNTAACIAQVRRTFLVCGVGNQSVTFNFSTRADDYTNSIIVDAGQAGATTLFNVPRPSMANPVIINTTLSLTPGQHTIDIICADFEDGSGSIFLDPNDNVQRQWNPFGILVTGTITTPGNSLLNSNPTAPAAIAGAESVCALNTITLTDATAGGTWQSSNTTVATISASGIVTGVQPGSVTITYTVGTGNCAMFASKIINVTNCHCEDSCSWSVTGNSAAKAWNFIGPINAADFNIRTTNTQRIRVPANGIVTVPAGTSYPALLIAPDGTLFRSNTTLSRPANTSPDQQQQINSLQDEISILKEQIKVLMKSIKADVETIANNTRLNISPNPFSDNTQITYSIMDFNGNAALQVLDANNNLLKTFALKQANGKVDISGAQLPSSMIVINIISDGKILASKKVIKIK